MQSSKTAKVAVLNLLAAAVLVGSLGTGCPPDGVPLLPRIVTVQLPDEPNFTVAFSVEDAVSDPSDVAKINWVFGDGSGFVEGPAGRISITHRYAAAGTFEVTAFVFDAEGLAAQVDGTATVVPNGDGSSEPPPAQALPGGISGPNPQDAAQDVAVVGTLTWTGSGDADSYDVYLLGTDTEPDEQAAEQAVTDATNTDDTGIFRVNQTDTEFDPEGLEPETTYFWRVDEINAAGSTPGEVMSFTTAAAPEAADDFVPADGVMTARVDQILQWTAGDGATAHDVYFGKDPDEVANATPDDPDVFQGNQTAATFDPQDETAEIDGQLLASTQYYWRIDAVGLGGTTTGAVLAFTTAAAPPQVIAPVPADAATDVNISQNLSWSAEPSVESFDVYMGTDEVAVGAATRVSPEFEGNQTSKIFGPAELIGQTDYFWRVDTLGPGGTTRGNVFLFTTAAPPSQVVAPFAPTNNETNVDVETLLSWGAGAGGTTSFDVYFGTNETAVNNGQSSAFQGNQNVGETSFDPTNVSPDTVFFWRIDAVGPGGTTTGPVLSFHTGALPDQADNPMPANGELGVALNTTLGWGAGLGAASYDVYFGTDQAAVQNAQIDDAEFRGNVAVTTFDPGELDGATNYFWRIDPVSPGGTTQGAVWQFTTAPGKATAPQPEHESTGAALDAQLGWSAGSGAVSHDVYFGTDAAAVQAATPASAEFKGNQSATTFDPGALDGATTYYWRIDEVGNDGTTAGDVWSFTTAAGQAAQPIAPADGEMGVDIETTLTWNAGDGAVSHDVFLGTNENSVDSATRSSPEFEGNQTATVFTPLAPLNGDTTYFWRIDEIDADDNVTQGAVWQFHTGTGPASDPLPADADTGVDINTSLTWTAGSGATSHDVYLGTDPVAVGNATPASPEFEGNQTTTTFVPVAVLDGATTYYWRIDEIGPGGTTAGVVWSFTTGAGQATAPDPADGGTGTALNPLLIWTPGAAAASHDVYFGTTEAAVLSASRTSAEFQGNQIGTTFSPGVLDGLTWHFWRIDELDVDGNTTQGVVWQFRTGPGKATNPDPADFAIDVPLNQLLQWTAGIGATEHHVYLGISLVAVTNAGPADPEFQGSQIGTIFAPVVLTEEQTYFWRIDEVAADGTTITTGDVWRFTTAALP